MATAEVVKGVSAYQFEPGIATTYNISNGYLMGAEEHESIHELMVQPLFDLEQPPNPRPDLVQYAAVRDPKLRIVQAIPLNVSVEDEHVIVCWSETDEFGTGDTLSEALDDFANGLRDLHHQLFAPEVRLGADLQKVKTIIEKYIQPR